MNAMKQTKQKQSGAVLMISLVMLLLLTIIGLTGTQVTSLEEKMAGNSRDYNAAFQAAETTLREAEAFVNSLVTVGGFGATAGLLGEADSDGQNFYLDTANWDSNTANTTPCEGSRTATSTFAQIPAANTPCYIVKFVVEEAPDTNAKLNIGGYGEKLAGAQSTIFRITARSTGITGQSNVVLQSYYGKRF